jgi:hypothetical protein
MSAVQLFTPARREDAAGTAGPASAPSAPRRSAADVRKKLEKTEAEQERFRKDQAGVERGPGM